MMWKHTLALLILSILTCFSKPNQINGKSVRGHSRSQRREITFSDENNVVNQNYSQHTTIDEKEEVEGDTLTRRLNPKDESFEISSKSSKQNASQSPKSPKVGKSKKSKSKSTTTSSPPSSSSTSNPTESPISISSTMFEQQFKITNNKGLDKDDEEALCKVLASYTSEYVENDDTVETKCTVTNSSLWKKAMITTIYYTMEFESKRPGVFDYDVKFANYINHHLELLTEDLKKAGLPITKANKVKFTTSPTASPTTPPKPPSPSPTNETTPPTSIPTNIPNPPTASPTIASSPNPSASPSEAPTELITSSSPSTGPSLYSGSYLYDYIYYHDGKHSKTAKMEQAVSTTLSDSEQMEPIIEMNEAYPHRMKGMRIRVLSSILVVFVTMIM